MLFTFGRNNRRANTALAAAVFLTFGLCLLNTARAQDHTNDRRDYDHGDSDRARRLDPGTMIPVRANEPIDSRAVDHRIYRGIVAEDVRGDNGRLVVPAGSPVELTVRLAPDNDLKLDMVSVIVNGQRYGVQADPKHVEARQQGGTIGGIIGAITNNQISGRKSIFPETRS